MLLISSTVAASWLAWRWRCDSPRTGCAPRKTPTCMAQTSI